MTNGENRVFDPEAVAAFRVHVGEEIERVEKMRTDLSEGDLNRAPAFGYANGAQTQARVAFGEFHGHVWNKLNTDLKELYEVRDYLDQQLEGYDDAELESARELEQMQADKAGRPNQYANSAGKPDLQDAPEPQLPQ